jgi:hypothetical protein
MRGVVARAIVLSFWASQLATKLASQALSYLPDRTRAEIERSITGSIGSSLEHQLLQDIGVAPLGELVNHVRLHADIAHTAHGLGLIPGFRPASLYVGAAALLNEVTPDGPGKMETSRLALFLLDPVMPSKKISEEEAWFC